MYTFFFNILFHYGLSQDIEYSSLCYTVGPCCLSIRHILFKDTPFAVTSYGAEIHRPLQGAQVRSLLGELHFVTGRLGNVDQFGQPWAQIKH